MGNQFGRIYYQRQASAASQRRNTACDFPWEKKLLLEVPGCYPKKTATLISSGRFIREPDRQVFIEAMPVPFVATGSLALASRFQLAG